MSRNTDESDGMPIQSPSRQETLSNSRDLTSTNAASVGSVQCNSGPQLVDAALESNVNAHRPAPGMVGQPLDVFLIDEDLEDRGLSHLSSIGPYHNLPYMRDEPRSPSRPAGLRRRSEAALASSAPLHPTEDSPFNDSATLIQQNKVPVSRDTAAVRMARLDVTPGRGQSADHATMEAVDFLGRPLRMDTGRPAVQHQTTVSHVKQPRDLTERGRGELPATVLAAVLADGSLRPFGTAPPAAELSPALRAHYDSVRQGDDDGPAAASMVSEALAATGLISSGVLESTGGNGGGGGPGDIPGGLGGQSGGNRSNASKESDQAVPLGAPALWLFRCPTATRSFSELLLGQPWFDPLSLAFIFANCVLLAIETPASLQSSAANDNDAAYNAQVLRGIDLLFTIYFTLELMVRMFALGIDTKDSGSFFRSGWNWLDLAVVVEGIVSQLDVLAVGISLAPLRAVRALRPLRSIDRLPGLRQLVDSILFSLPMLLNAFAVMLLFFAVYAGIGVQLWRGDLRQRCFDASTGHLVVGDSRPCGGLHSCSAGGNGLHVYDGNSSEAVSGVAGLVGSVDSERQVCGLHDLSPAAGTLGFDNVLQAGLLLMSILTQEGWSSAMYAVQDASTPWAWVYFVTALLLGGVLLVHSLAAIMLMKFNESTRTREREAKMQAAVEQARDRTRARVLEQERQRKQDALRKSNQSEAAAGRLAIMRRMKELGEALRSKPEGAAPKGASASMESGRATADGQGEPAVPIANGSGSAGVMDSDSNRDSDSDDDDDDDDSRGGNLSDSARTDSSVEFADISVLGQLPEVDTFAVPVGLDGLKAEAVDPDRGRASSGSSEPSYRSLDTPMHQKQRRCSAGSSIEADESGHQELGSLQDNMHDKGTNRHSGRIPATPAASVAAHSSVRLPHAARVALCPSSAHPASKSSASAGDAASQRRPIQPASAQNSRLSDSILSATNNHAYGEHGGTVQLAAAILQDALVRSDGDADEAGALLRGKSHAWWSAHLIGGNRVERAQGDSADGDSSVCEGCLGCMAAAQDCVCPRDSTAVQYCQLNVSLPLELYVVRRSWFDSLMTITVLVNTVALALQHHGMSSELEQGLNATNTIITGIFAGELALKLLGMGLAGYCSDVFNVFDGLVTLIAVVELVVAGPGGGSGQGRAISVLRLLRIVRVFRLVRHWESMQHLLRVLVRTLPQFGYLALLLLLFLFVYSVMGMHLLAGAYQDDLSRSLDATEPFARARRAALGLPTNTTGGYTGFSPEELEAVLGETASTRGINGGLPLFELPRNHFDSMAYSFITMFQVLAGQGWNHIARDVAAYASPWYLILIVSWVFVGRFILLNLFLAITIAAFDDSGEDTGTSGHENAADLQHTAMSMLRQAKQVQDFHSVNSGVSIQSGVVLARKGTFQQLVASAISLPRLAKATNSEAQSATESSRPGSSLQRFHDSIGRSDHIGGAATNLTNTPLATGSEAPQREMGSGKGAATSHGPASTGPGAVTSGESVVADSREGASSSLSPSSRGSSIIASVDDGQVDWIDDADCGAPEPAVQPPTAIRGSSDPPATPPQKQLLVPSAILRSAQGKLIKASRSQVGSKAAEPDSRCSVTGAALLSESESESGSEPEPEPEPEPESELHQASIHTGSSFAHQSKIGADSCSQSKDQPAAGMRSRLSARPSLLGARAQSCSSVSEVLGAGAGSRSSASEVQRSKAVALSAASRPLACSATGVTRKECMDMGRIRQVAPPDDTTHWTAAPSQSLQLQRSPSTRSSPSTCACTFLPRDGERPSDLRSLRPETDYWALQPAALTRPRLRQRRATSDKHTAQAPDVAQAPGVPLVPTCVMITCECDATRANCLCCDAGGVCADRAGQCLDWELVCRWGSRDSHWRISTRGITQVLTIISTIAMAVSGHPSGQTSAWVRAIDVLASLAFAVELALRCIRHGVLMHKQAVLRSVQGILDAAFVLGSVIELAAVLPSAGVDRESIPRAIVLTAVFARVLRCTRPFRSLSISRGVARVGTALCNGLPGMVNVLGIVLLVWFLLAVLGVQLFAGAIRACSDPLFPEGALLVPQAGDSVLGVSNSSSASDANGTVPIQPMHCEGTFLDTATGLQSPRRVIVGEWTFDNSAQALLALFVASSGEAWPGMMFGLVDAVGPNTQPRRDNNMAASMFFAALVVLVQFFLLQLVVTAIYGSFRRVQSKQHGARKLTKRHSDWLAAQEQLSRARPHQLQPVARTELQESLLSFVDSEIAHKGAMACIVLSALAQLSVHHGQPRWVDPAIEWASQTCAAVLVLEACACVFAMQWQGYWARRRNRFNLVLAVAGCIDLLIVPALRQSAPAMSTAAGQTVVRCMQALRFARLFRVARSFPEVHGMMQALARAAPAVFQLIVIVACWLLAYGIAGMALFGDQDTSAQLGPHGNFKTIGSATLLLLRCATGEGWEQVMKAAWRGGGIFRWAAAPYFLSFALVTVYTLMRAFVLVIVDEFERWEEESTGSAALLLADFRRAWAKADPFGKGWIAVRQLEAFLRDLPEPMGLGHEAPFSDFLLYLRSLNLSAWDGCVSFREVLLACHRETIGVGVPEHARLAMRMRPDRVKSSVQASIENWKASQQGEGQSADCYSVGDIGTGCLGRGSRLPTNAGGALDASSTAAGVWPVVAWGGPSDGLLSIIADPAIAALAAVPAQASPFDQRPGSTAILKLRARKARLSRELDLLAGARQDLERLSALDATTRRRDGAWQGPKSPAKAATTRDSFPAGRRTDDADGKKVGDHNDPDATLPAAASRWQSAQMLTQAQQAARRARRQVQRSTRQISAIIHKIEARAAATRARIRGHSRGPEAEEKQRLVIEAEMQEQALLHTPTWFSRVFGPAEAAQALRRLQEARIKRVRAELGLWSQQKQGQELAFGDDSDGEGEEGGTPQVVGLRRELDPDAVEAARSGWSASEEISVRPRDATRTDALLLVAIAKARPKLLEWRRRALASLSRKRVRRGMNRVRGAALMVGRHAILRQGLKRAGTGITRPQNGNTEIQAAAQDQSQAAPPYNQLGRKPQNVVKLGTAKQGQQGDPGGAATLEASAPGSQVQRSTSAVDL